MQHNAHDTSIYAAMPAQRFGYTTLVPICYTYIMSYNWRWARENTMRYGWSAVLSVTVTLALCSCGVQRLSALRTQHEGAIAFVAHRNYQEVYRLIRESPYLPVQETESEIYTDIDEAHIWFQTQVTPFGYFVLIDIKKIGKDCTSIKYYYLYSAWQDTGRQIKGLFPKATTDNAQQCAEADPKTATRFRAAELRRLGVQNERITK